MLSRDSHVKFRLTETEAQTDRVRSHFCSQSRVLHSWLEFLLSASPAPVETAVLTHLDGWAVDIMEQHHIEEHAELREFAWAGATVVPVGGALTTFFLPCPCIRLALVAIWFRPPSAAMWLTFLLWTVMLPDWVWQLASPWLHFCHQGKLRATCANLYASLHDRL